MSLRKKVPKHVAEFPASAQKPTLSTPWVGVGLDLSSFETHWSTGHTIYPASEKEPDTTWWISSSLLFFKPPNSGVYLAQIPFA